MLRDSLVAVPPPRGDAGRPDVLAADCCCGGSGPGSVGLVPPPLEGLCAPLPLTALTVLPAAPPGCGHAGKLGVRCSGLRMAA